MAEIIKSKTLNTILRLKYDTLANWKAANEYVPMKGEVCIVAVPKDAQQVASEPAILFKVGDGAGVVFKKEGSDKTELPWASGLAADVHAWAKKSQAAAEDVKVLTEGHTFNNKTVTEALTSLNDQIAALIGGENGGSIQDLIDASIGNLDATLNRSANNKYIIGIKQVDGVITELVEADLPDYANVYAAKELETTVSALRGEFDAHTIAVSGYDTRITAAQTKAEANATEIATVRGIAEAAYVLPEGGIESDLSDGVKASLALADSALQATDITNLATKGEVEAVAGDLSTLNDKVDAEIKARGEADQKHTDDIAANATKIATLIGSDADKSVRTIANEELAAQLIAEGADEKLDTLKEIADWIQAHPGDAATMNTAIQALQAKTVLGTYVDGEETKEYATVKAYVEAAIAALNIGDYALAADLTALAGRVSTAETAIENITKEGGAIDTAIAAEAEARNTAIADAIGALDSSIAATAEVDNKVSVLTGITETDGKLTAKEEVTLSAIAKTGNINDLIQTEGEVLVLFGGNAFGYTE